jgi:integrase
MGRSRSDFVDTWGGGYIRRDGKGRKVFVIQTTINGHRFHVSTRTHTEGAAVAQWERFQKNPSAYTPTGDDGGPLPLSDELIEEYLEACREAGTSEKWIASKRRYLVTWQAVFDGRSLRRLTAREHILPARDRQVRTAEGKRRKLGAWAHRIATLKHLFTWLRTEKHLVSAAEDPTFGVIHIPQSNPLKRRIRDKAVPRSNFLAARKHLAGHWRWALDVLAGTGAHVTAVARFASDGQIEPYHGDSEGTAGVLVFVEKDGEEHRVGVTAECLAAAKRLRARGSLDRDKFDDAVHAACVAAGVAPFTPARMRHTVATWAVENGATKAEVADFLGHKDPRTTERFYATHAVPKPVPTLL